MAAREHHLHVPERTHEVHPNLILAVLSLAGLAYAVLSSAVIPALTTLQHELHTSETGVTWLLTGFLLSASVGTAVIGRLGDIYGKERVLLLTLVVLAFGTLLAALATTLAVLIVARVIQGVAGGIFPLAFAIARDEFPRDRVAGSIGLMSSILGIGGGLGLVIGALIVEHLGWHWLFWLPLAVTVLAAIATWRYIPESPIRAPGRINWLAASVMSLGFSLVLIGIAQTSVWGWGSVKTVALLAAGLAVCGLWVVIELRSTVPLVDMAMMRIRGVWTTNLAAFLLGAGLYSSFIVYPAVRPTAEEHRVRVWRLDRRRQPVPAAGGARDGLAGKPRRPRRAAIWLEAGAGRRIADQRGSVRLSGAQACAPLQHADFLSAARGRHRPCLLGARQPDRAGGSAVPDRGRERDEYRDADTGRGARRTDRGHPDCRPHGERPADGDWVHRDVLDGHRRS